jgi:FkbM family methyltransferase
VLRDPLGEGWYDHDWGRQPEIELLRRGRFGPGARVFDLGAHQGLVALILAREVGEDGVVIAVEAEPHNARVAAENRALNAASNLTIVHAAVSDVAGTLYFSEGLNGMVLPGGRAGKVAVDAVTIDGLAERFGPPDVVFVDVEGYEGKALEGALVTLDDGGCDFFVEIHDAATLAGGGTSVDRVITQFTDRGFGCLVAEATDGPVSSEFRELSSGIHKRGERCYLVAFGHRTTFRGRALP